jgi:serine/threonine protein kinase
VLAQTLVLVASDCRGHSTPTLARDVPWRFERGEQLPPTFSRTLVIVFVQANILVSSDREIKIANSGLANFAMSYSTDQWGTPRRMAPELLDVNQKFQRTTKSDIFAFACTAFEVGSPSTIFRVCLGKADLVQLNALDLHGHPELS